MVVRRVSPASDLCDVQVSHSGALVAWHGRDDGWSYDAYVVGVRGGDVVLRVRAFADDGGSTGVPMVWHLPASTNLLRLVADGVEAVPVSEPGDDDEGVVTVRTVLRGCVVGVTLLAGWVWWAADLVDRFTGAFGGAR